MKKNKKLLTGLGILGGAAGIATTSSVVTAIALKNQNSNENILEIKKLLQKTKYIDKNSQEQEIDQIDLFFESISEITQIGYYENLQGQIQVIRMPRTIQEVPSKLPKQTNSLKGMFSSVVFFNQDLSSWDTSKVTDMSFMFNRATEFNGNISNWNTSNVTDMRVMFQNAAKFNQDISEWDTSKVKDNKSFNGGSKFTRKKLSKWVNQK